MINGVLHIIASPILDENSIQVGIVETKHPYNNKYLVQKNMKSK